MEFALGRDVTIHYEEFGKGRPLFGLHGWGLDHKYEVWTMEPHFANREGWRRIYLDLPGMGQTKAADWIRNQDQVLEIVLEFIEAMAPGERLVVEGHSYGAYLCRGILMQKGDQVGGAFLNAPPVPWGGRDNLPEQFVVREDPDFLDALRPDEEDLRALFVSQSLEALNDFRSIAPAGSDTEFLARLDESGPFSFEADLPGQTFAGPALIIAGKQDSWVGYDNAFALVANFARATYAVLDGAGHAVAMERKSIHRALVGDWLDRVEHYIRHARLPNG
jgi:pimeloyl-ACP methyl ester carboxylesterase